MNLLEQANESQRRAITHRDGPALIVAGAGTGKTRVITTRIAWLIMDKGVNVDEILALTFTEKAAEEMEERVDRILPYGYVDLWISTFHAFCDKLLKRHALDIGLPNNYKLLDETQAWLLIRKNLEKFNLDYYRPLGNPTKFIHALLKHFSRCKDEGIYPEDYLRYAEKLTLDNDAAEFVKKLDLSEYSEAERAELKKQEILRINEVANAYHVYQQLLLQNDSLDFADLINWTIKLFKQRPWILDKYRRQFKYILVDEFQDTNFVQYELIKLLAAPKNNLMVVLDDDQSIYHFRGSSMTNALQFKIDFPGAESVVLLNNYRSCQAILDLAYKFIVQNNPNRLEVTLGVNKKLKSHVEGSAIIEHIHKATNEDEAQAVIERIGELKSAQKAEWSDFAILVRANDSAVSFTVRLEQAGIPYQFMAMRGLYNKPAVVDVISYFKLLDNYHEASALYRVLNMPLWQIAPSEIVKIIHYARMNTISVFESLKCAVAVPQIDPSVLPTLNKIVVQVEKGALLAKSKRPSELFLNFIYDSGYLAYLNKLNNSFGRECLAHWQQFFKKIQAFENSAADPRLAEFMELVEMEMEAGDSGKLPFDTDVGPDMVRIMTVHGAKGLEFDYVFLSNLVDRKFPTDERKEAIEIPDALIREKLPEGDFHLEEERRLFYVAMTRARKGLFFTSADDYGGAREKKLSRFLVELGYAKPEPAASVGKAVFAAEPVTAVARESGASAYTLPKKFSFSQMQTYEQCPLKYKFANILNIPVFGSHYFSFGTSVHDALYKILTEELTLRSAGQPDLFGVKNEGEVKHLPLARVMEIYEACWKPEWYQDEKQKQEYFDKGKKLIKNFWQDFGAQNPNIEFLEQDFNIKIGEYSFAGRIDRVDKLAPDKFEIIDYKTGQGKTELSTDDRRQLLFYQIAAEDTLHFKPEKLTYYYLEKGERLSFVGKEADREKLKLRFLDNIAKIKKGEFDPAPSEHVCAFCDYKGICEFRKI